MRKNINSLIEAVSVILLVLTATFSASRINTAYGVDARHSMLFAPGSKLTNSLPKTETYTVSTSYGADYVDTIDVAFPAGWAFSSAIPLSGCGPFASSADGSPAVEVAAVDQAGISGSATKLTIIDNSMPSLVNIYVKDQTDAPLFLDPSGNFWMTKDTTAISVWADFNDPSSFTGYLYIGSTEYAFIDSTWTPVIPPGYNVSAINTVTLNITLVNLALSSGNRFSRAWTVARDNAPPSAPTITSTTNISGGVVVRGLISTDNAGIQRYNVYFDGASVYYVYPSDLNSIDLSWDDPFATFQGALVIDLNYLGYSVGDLINVTIRATDYGSNLGAPVTFFATVLDGQWYPLEMNEGWNLVSWPLIPRSPAATDVLSLMLKNGATNVLVTYGYDQNADRWMVNPTQMSDGSGYWVNLQALDVLIVEGKVNLTPPALPTSYPMTPGWVLCGYKSIHDRPCSEYLASLQPGSYYRFIYVFNAWNKQWEMRDTTFEGLNSGDGFWICMYDTQTLRPPTP